MRCLYREGKALPPHECTLDYNAAIFHIDEHVRSLPDLTTALLVRSNDPLWMMDVVHTFNKNPSGVPRNLRTEGAYVNDVDVWYWVSLIKSKYCGADAKNALQTIFSTTGQWSSIATGQWKKNNSEFLCNPAPMRLLCWVTPDLARTKIKPYFQCREMRLIWNKITLRSQLRANEINSLKGADMNHFWVHDSLLPFVNDRLDYGEEGFFSQPPVDTWDLREHIQYFDSLVPKGTVHESTEELTHDLYADNVE
ncbi:hypothetical protein M422DRAFT_247681 [Sphaerobolus stellatus SS14]|nr:hypothetical protein M422DRAFT_247681 [Sphaerobolus stellatus SS14]